MHNHTKPCKGGLKISVLSRPFRTFSFNARFPVWKKGSVFIFFQLLKKVTRETDTSGLARQTEEIISSQCLSPAAARFFLAQMFAPAGLHRRLAEDVRLALELAEKPVVEIVAIGQHHQRRFLYRRMPHHARRRRAWKTLAAALHVPGHARATVARPAAYSAMRLRRKTAAASGSIANVGELINELIVLPSNCVTPREFRPAQCRRTRVQLSRFVSNMETKTVFKILVEPTPAK
jgi:hypothetical protein